MISELNEIGELDLKFSQEMFFAEVFAELLFFDTKLGIEDREEDAENNLENDVEERRRRLQKLEVMQRIDLFTIIDIEIVRGSDDTSCPQSDLGFEAELVSFSDDGLDIKIRFDNPLSLSIGEHLDILKVTFIEHELFTSKESGKTIKPMTIIEKKIPRQFPDSESFQFTVKARETLYLTANASFLLSFGFTILLAASMKTMWNMIHFIQVIAYMRLLINWPANARMIL